MQAAVEIFLILFSCTIERQDLGSKRKRASHINSEQGKASVVPSQLRALALSSYPSRQLQKNEAGILTQSWSQLLNELF